MVRRFPRNLVEFERQFRSEEDRLKYLDQIRWSQGFRYLRCAAEKAWRVGEWDTMAAFPSWSVQFLARGGPATMPAGAETLTLKVSGMDCAACTVAIRRSLENVPGVYSASMDFDAAKATVVTNAKVDSAAVLKAVTTAGYKAVMVEGGRDGKPKA